MEDSTRKLQDTGRKDEMEAALDDSALEKVVGGMASPKYQYKRNSKETVKVQPAVMTDQVSKQILEATPAILTDDVDVRFIQC